MQSERRPETVNRQETSELTTLKPSSEGAGISRPLRFRVEPEICAHRRPLRPEAQEEAGLAERSPEDTVKWGVDHSTSRQRFLIGLSPRASGLLPHSFLKNNNGPQIRLHFEGCGWTPFPCPHYLGGGERKATLCLCAHGMRSWLRCLT